MNVSLSGLKWSWTSHVKQSLWGRRPVIICGASRQKEGLMGSRENIGGQTLVWYLCSREPIVEKQIFAQMDDKHPWLEAIKCDKWFQKSTFNRVSSVK